MITGLRLTRKLFRSDGIFSELRDDKGNLLAETIEHAYELSPGDWRPKIPNGTYECLRGLHRLHNMTEPFETFEITGVAGHDGLLFHWGNVNADSDGCVCVGKDLVTTRKQDWVTFSRITFKAFMGALEGLQSVPLTVIG